MATEGKSYDHTGDEIQGGLGNTNMHDTLVDNGCDGGL